MPIMHTGSQAPIDERYFESNTNAQLQEAGSISVCEAAIIEAGHRYDPLPLHKSTEAGRHTQFGGVIASGWQTAGLMMRLVVDHYLSHVASLASPGLDEL